MQPRVHYRKLPGHRRGVFRGSSIWLGPDHLLLVRSLRFREEYKRYQFRDIQAIVVAKATRFHISTRAVFIAALWLVAYPLASAAAARTGVGIASILWVLAALLVVAWLVVSSAFSCRCRIYTAVSRDDLPSLYRIWTARKFLRQVEPLIRQAQGALDGPWAQAVENRNIGPAEAAGLTPIATRLQGQTKAPARSLASDILIAGLFADAIWNAITLHSPERWAQVINSMLTLIEAGAAIAVIVQHYRGFLRSAMQKLGIATLAVIGIFFYLRPVVVGFMVGARAAASKQPMSAMLPIDPHMREIDAVIAAVLGLVGLGIVLAAGSDEEKPQIITPST